MIHVLLGRAEEGAAQQVNDLGFGPGAGIRVQPRQGWSGGPGGTEGLQPFERQGRFGDDFGLQRSQPAGGATMGKQETAAVQMTHEHLSLVHG